MTDDTRAFKQEKVYNFLKDASFGIISTVSANNGYPSGNITEFYFDESNDIYLLGSNIAQYVRDMTVSPKIGLTILKQDENCEFIHQISINGKIKKLDKKNIEMVKRKYLEKFPESIHIVDDDSYNFFKLEIFLIRYIGKDESFSIKFNPN